MIKNYFKTAWRNLWKNKTFSAINIFGLSVGIAAFLLIVNYLRFEYSYDDAHLKKSRIFRVPMMTKEKGGKEQTFAFTYPAVAPAMKKDFPEVEEAARFRRQGGIVTYGDQKIVEGGTLYYADASLFNIFSFRFVKGNTATAFKELSDAVITEETAKKYFGKDDPIGKALHYRNEDYIVKGVLEDVPANSHIRFNILLNYEKYIQLTNGDANTSWGWSDFYTYVLLKPGTDVKALEAKLPAFAERYMGDDMKQRDYENSFYLQPLKDIHLRSKYDYEMAGNGNLTYLKYLGIAALFILFIAWINYVNLSTAHSLDRSKEVGIRKVVGAGRFQLIRQFLAESLFLNITATLFGILIFRLTLSSFSTLVEKDISSLYVSDWRFWLFAITLFLLGTLLAAFYPAFVLSSFQPVYSIKTSKGVSGLKGGKSFLRKSLVVLQFIAAIVLITGAIGFYRQLHYMQSRDLGVNIKQTLVVQQTANQDSSDIPAFTAFVNDMESNPAIQSVTSSTSVPGAEVGGSSDYALKNSQAGKRCRNLGIDNKFIPAYGLSIIAGRNITNDKPAVDTNVMVNILVNETAAKVFGFGNPTDILGQYIDGSGFHCKVIGVVKDFHQESLQYDFDPIVFYPEEERSFGNFSLKLNTTNLPALMDFVKQKWSTHFPQSPFRFFFLDERFNAQYKNDRLFATVLWLFTAIAISIACLGLFGLSLFTIAKRNKEISIRKVLGATLFQITSLITKDYLKLVLLAGVIALPVAYILVNNWMKDYAFHTSIGLWFFLLPVIMIVSVALLTVLYQSLKAGVSNPVKNLRTE
ncbi:MAG: FtsX-like permease family protein [Chitinophagaceae bacterium]|nr:MAG: FtsX-like permease family protein [Chitinophagaceae bacterium]